MTGQGLLDMDGVLTHRERELLLERLDSVFAWVGTRIPDRIELEGKPMELQKLVQELMTRESLTVGELDRAHGLERSLKAKEKALERELEQGELSETEALSVYQEARGLLRAILDLRELGRDPEPYEVTALKARLADEKRWVKLLRSVGQLH